MNKYLPIVILISCFLFIKLTNYGIRVSDANSYFYIGYQLLQGKLLYKDIFFTNFPLFGYASSLYYLLSFKQISLYYLTAAIEASVVSFLLYTIILKQTKRILYATLSASLYLFSFILLATTDHQTGVFLASLFAVLSYYFYTEKKYFLTGVFIAFALLTKAYFLPIAATYGVLFLWEFLKGEGEIKGKHLTNIAYFTMGGTITALIVLLPTLLFAAPDFINDVFQYSLTRSQGLSKGNILRFFVLHDFLIVLSFIYSLIMIRRHLFFGVLGIFSIVFLIFYKDVYYLYLNFLVPFFCLASISLYQDIQNRIKTQEMILPTIISFFLIANLFIYISGYKTLAKIENVDVLVTVIKQLNPPAIYGDNSLVTAFAYLSDTPMVNTSIDTNPNRFRAGSLNAKELTKKAMDQNAVFIAEGIDYPEYGVRQDIITEIFDTSQMKNCGVVKALPVKTEGTVNRINLIACNK